jgi:putative DNA-invertase from lambdoid prophage Rac
MATFAYLRISTKDQTTEQQMTQINAAGFSVDKDRIFIEHGVSGKVPALQREQFHRLNDRLFENDQLVVNRLDRLGRDILDVIATVRNLTDRGITLVVLGLGTLDNSAQSNLTLNMLAAISEFERQIIGERTKAKLDQLKSEGKKLGRPVKVSNDELKAKTQELIAGGLSWRKTAAQVGVSLSTVQRIMKAAA